MARNLLLLLTLVSFFFSYSLIAQSDEEVLFTFGQDQVKVGEFMHVYEKNNMLDSLIYERASIDEYLELYTNFKLKVKEAESRGYDTLPNINKELATYRKQLAKTYLTDKQITEKLMKEAYERMQSEVEVAHILFKTAGVGDDITAFQKAEKVKKEIMEGADFTEMAKKHSGDPSVKDNDGKLGYVSVFQTVYPFENAVYNTEPGTISDPIKTKFGYHLVKVDNKRKSRGKLKVAHILVKIPADAKEDDLYKNKIDTIYQQAIAGTDFSQLARMYSDDRATSAKGGELPMFGSGRMVKEFEDASFALDNIGDISKPIKTRFGFHLIKLLDRKTVGTYKEMTPEIKRRLNKDARSSVSKDLFVERLLKEYKYKEHDGVLEDFIAKVTDQVLIPKYRKPDSISFDAKLYDLDGKTYIEQDLVDMLQKKTPGRRGQAKEVTIRSFFKNMVADQVMNMEESRLETKYPEFKRQMKEYRDGILLFELTDEMVWSKAVADSVGLQDFYDRNKGTYMWKQRAEAVIYECKDEATAEKARELVGKRKYTAEEIQEEINADGQELISYKEGKYEKGQNGVLDQIPWDKGLSFVIFNKDKTTSFADVMQILEPMPKELSEARGYIVSDYQKELEAAWIKELRKKYPVKVDKDVQAKLYNRKK